MTAEAGRLLGIREVAELFGVDISTVRRWERAGHLSSVRVGTRGHRRYHRDEVQSLLQGRHPAQGPPADDRPPAGPG